MATAFTFTVENAVLRHLSLRVFFFPPPECCLSLSASRGTKIFLVPRTPLSLAGQPLLGFRVPPEICSPSSFSYESHTLCLGKGKNCVSEPGYTELAGFGVVFFFLKQKHRSRYLTPLGAFLPQLPSLFLIFLFVPSTFSSSHLT